MEEMENKFNKYKNTIIGFYTNLDISKYLINNLIKDIFQHEIIMKITQSDNKVSLFFEEFDKVNNDSKYESFIKITKETSDWVELCFKDSAEESMENFKMFWEMLTIQIEDFKKSLVINEVTLQTCFIIGLISDVQHSELCACFDQHGVENTKIRFLSTIYLKSTNWYGKLLFIYYKYKTNFIPDFLPELSTELGKLKTEEEKKNYIFQYGDSIIETNKNAFKVPHDDIPRNLEFDKELEKLHIKDDREECILQCDNKVCTNIDKENAIDENMSESALKFEKMTSDWIAVFIKNHQEAEVTKKKFKIIFDIFQQQHVESIHSLQLDESVLFQCKNLEVINNIEFSEMETFLKENDLNNAKIKFVLILVNKCDWFEKLLHVYDTIKSDFIPCNMNNLYKELEKLHNNDDRKKYIFQYCNKVCQNINEENAINENISESALKFEKITSNWIESFVKNPKEAEDSRKTLEIMFDLFRIQNVDHIDSLHLDDCVLFQCRNLKYITDTEFGEMQAFLKENGLKNAKIKFLMIMSTKGPGWYGKILHIYDILQSNFIHDYLPDLDKDLNPIQIDSERKDYIYGYANSIVEHNQNQFEKSKTDKSKDLKIEFMEFDSPKETSNYDVKMECIESVFTQGDTKELSLSGCNANQSINDMLGLDDLEMSLITDTEVIDEQSSISEDKKSVQTTSFNDSQISIDSGLHKEETSSSDSDLTDEDIEFDDLFGHLENKSVQELLHFSPPPNNSQPMESSPLEIRNYQRELAEHGIGGKNVLICSPTGSGKTIVAVKIVKEHLSKTKDAKVAFLVHRIALVEQQYNQFVKYIDCKITRLTGNSKSLGTPFIGHLKSFQVFVLTSDILRNALEDESETKLESLNVFSLILFDECHNCDKKHPYNRIMNHYFKLKKSGQKVPQIIGLTASTGTNKAGTMDKALKRLFQLCANLDTYIVSTVKEFKDELEKVQSKPQESILSFFIIIHNFNKYIFNNKLD